MKSALTLFVFTCTFCFGQRSDFKNIDFKKADSVAELYSGASLANLPVLTHNLTFNLTTDVEKFRAMYTWVGTNIENDYSSYLKTRKKRSKLSKNQEALLEWNNSFTPRVFENLLKHKKTACTGYAYLIKEMASLADINCKIIDGYGRTATLILDENSIPNHSWNAVELNGKWYVCDATWSAGQTILEEKGPRFQSDYFDGYFLAEPSLFIKNHFPLDIDLALTSEAPNFKTFLEGPVIYKEAFSSNIIPTAPTKMRVETLKNERFSFYLSSTEDIEIESIVLVLNNGGGSKTVQPKISRDENNYILQHIFKNSGKYDVHVKVAGSIIATYVVKVRRK